MIKVTADTTLLGVYPSQKTSPPSLQTDIHWSLHETQSVDK